MSLSRRSPLKRTGNLKRSRLKPRSDKVTQVYADERRPLVAELLALHPWCQLRVKCRGDARAVDVHELLSRGRGGSITDRRNCLTACRKCHTWVTENSQAAQCLGLALPSWASNAVSDPWGAAAVLRTVPHGPCPWRPEGGPCASSDDAQALACNSRWLPDTIRRTLPTDTGPPR